MAKLATCPGCTTQLALPENATLSDRARCPRCHEEFLLMETVQFSIPTAEILTCPEPETFSPTDTVNPTSYIPATDPYAPSAPDDGYTASSYEPSSESIESTTEPEPASLPTNATLSDWEARLKRALAGSTDDRSATRPSFELKDPILSEAELKEPATYEPQEFSVDDADLIPAAEQDDWSARGFLQEEEEPTVKFASDQTISDHLEESQFDDDQEIPPTIRTDLTAPRKKRQRSPLRTLASIGMGAVGIPLGLYALLWLRGPAGDMLHIAQYLPSFMLPSEFQKPDFGNSTGYLVEESTAGSTNAVEPVEAEQVLADNESQPEEIDDAEPLIREDAAVAPASAELPTYQGPTFDPVDATEFRVLLTAAQQAVPSLSEGDLKTKESVASKGQAYMVLARLAEKMSFLSQSLTTPADMTSAKAAEELITNTLHDEIVRRDLPQIALRWWQYAQRPSPGIVILGEVKKLQTTDAGTIAYISLGLGEATTEIPVLMWRTDSQAGDIIGVAGSIEQNPHDRLPAIDASLGPIVIAHTSFPLDSLPTAHDTGPN